MSEEFAIINQMRESPEDPTIRLVYADWLDEHGRGPQAEFVRLQCEIAALGLDRPSSSGHYSPTHRCLSCHGYWKMSPQNQTVRRRAGPPVMRIGNVHWQSLSDGFCEDCMPEIRAGPPRVVPLDPIASNLLASQSVILSAYNTDDGRCDFEEWIRPAALYRLSEVETWFRFGSLDRLTCTFLEAIAWLPKLVRKHPLRPATLTITDLGIWSGTPLTGSPLRFYLALPQMEAILRGWMRLKLRRAIAVLGSLVKFGFESEEDAHLWASEQLIALALKSKL
jgi:uncharacterized protein (TIGR02996 family)